MFLVFVRKIENFSHTDTHHPTATSHPNTQPNTPPHNTEPPNHQTHNPHPTHTQPTHSTPHPTPQTSVPLASSSCQGYRKTPMRDTSPPCLWIMGSSEKDRKACIIIIILDMIIIVTVTFIIIVIIRGSNHNALCVLLPSGTFLHDI